MITEQAYRQFIDTLTARCLRWWDLVEAVGCCGCRNPDGRCRAKAYSLCPVVYDARQMLAPQYKGYHGPSMPDVQRLAGALDRLRTVIRPQSLGLRCDADWPRLRARLVAHIAETCSLDPDRIREEARRIIANPWHNAVIARRYQLAAAVVASAVFWDINRKERHNV